MSREHHEDIDEPAFPRPERKTMSMTKDDFNNLCGYITNNTMAGWLYDDRVEFVRLARLGLESAERIETLTRENGELKEWKATEQQALISMAATLLSAGFKGESVVDGVKWLSDERDTALAQVEELTKVIANCYVMARRRARLCPPSEREYWDHVKRFCESAGSKPELLRSALPKTQLPLRDGNGPRCQR